jgi:hypothetical protein
MREDNMSTSIEELTAKAMSLPSQSRALLAERLVESLEEESIKEVWIVEAKKRRDEVRSGQVAPISGDEAMESVRKLIAK